jgi:hypothetical protein
MSSEVNQNFAPANIGKLMKELSSLQSTPPPGIVIRPNEMDISVIFFFFFFKFNDQKKKKINVFFFLF